MAKARTIFIVGESPLVEEYSALCVRSGQFPVVQPTATQGATRGVKKAVAPPKSTAYALELTNTDRVMKRKSLVLLDRALAPGVPIISSSTTVTVAEQSGWIARRERLIGIGALPSLLNGSLIEFASTRETHSEVVAGAKAFAALVGKDAAFVEDSIGLVMPRILCMLANEAYFTMMEGVAAGDDIDTAMKLGTNYPAGPVEIAAKIGLKHVYAVLSALHRHFGEDRYRVAPLLQQAVFRMD